MIRDKVDHCEGILIETGRPPVIPAASLFINIPCAIQSSNRSTIPHRSSGSRFRHSVKPAGTADDILQNRADQFFFPRFLKSASMRSFQLAASGAVGQARRLDTAPLMTS